MAAETLTLTLGATYQALSSGQATVLVYVEQAESGIRIHLGTTLPSAETDNWYPVGLLEEFEAFDLADGDIVYARARGSSAKVRILRR